MLLRHTCTAKEGLRPKQTLEKMTGRAKSARTVWLEKRRYIPGSATQGAGRRVLERSVRGNFSQRASASSDARVARLAPKTPESFPVATTTVALPDCSSRNFQHRRPSSW